MKVLLTLALSLILVLPNYAYAQEKQVCVSEQDTIDLITLLDASERDLGVMSSCETLVKQLYKEVQTRDTKIINITNDLIQAKQDVIKYRVAADRWKKVAWYTSISTAILVVIQVAPLL